MLKVKGLKGCLWHEGSNGLGVGPMWLRKLLPYRQLFDKAAREHDRRYDTQGNGTLRKVYDVGFLINCLCVCRTTWQCVTAWTYFILCRMFGWMFYRYDR